MKNKHLIGVFDEEDHLVEALELLKKNQIPIEEIYTPYPVHEAIHAIGKKSKFTYVAFFYGLVSTILILSGLYYTAVIDWPLNFGGKPSSAFPSFIIITIIMVILLVTLSSLFTFSVRANIYPGKDAILPDPRSTDDKFIIMFSENEDNEQVRMMLTQSGATEINITELQKQ